MSEPTEPNQSLAPAALLSSEALAGLPSGLRFALEEVLKKQQDLTSELAQARSQFERLERTSL
jgi:hypothetical protein